MKFELTSDRRRELEPLLAELDSWVRELEELDLAELEPARIGGTGVATDAPAD